MRFLASVKSLYLVAALIACLLYFFTLLVIRLAWQKLTNKKTSLQETAHFMATRWARCFFNSIPGWSIEIDDTGLKKKPQQTYVIVANHESSTDILALHFLNTNFSWLSKIEIFRFPLIGTAMRWMGCIPVNRSERSSRAKVIRLCENVIKEGRSIIFFPEGTRSTTGEIKDFKPGAFRLSQKTNTPILPIIIKGSNNLLQKGSLSFKKASIKLKILDPIYPEAEEDLVCYTQRVQKHMKAAHKKL